MSRKTKKQKHSKLKNVNSFEQQIVEVFANNPLQPLNIKQLSSRLGIMDAASKQILQNFIYKLENKEVLIKVSRSKHKLNPVLIEEVITGNQVVG